MNGFLSSTILLNLIHFFCYVKNSCDYNAWILNITVKSEKTTRPLFWTYIWQNTPINSGNNKYEVPRVVVVHWFDSNSKMVPMKKIFHIVKHSLVKSKTCSWIRVLASCTFSPPSWSVWKHWVSNRELRVADIHFSTENDVPRRHERTGSISSKFYVNILHK